MQKSTFAMEDGQAKVTLSTDEHEIITLGDILEAFGAPLNEEQAWALCYQCGKFLAESDDRTNVRLEDATGVLLSKDGNVCIASTAPENTENVKRTERVLINSLGRIIYRALDYGLSDEEERELSRPLEELIVRMTAIEDDGSNENNNGDARSEAGDSVNTDEGIVDEQDWDEEEEEEEEGKESLQDLKKHRNGDEFHDDGGKLVRISQLLKVCSHHLPQPTEAANHYQAVCRAVYAEYQDLATFLKKISGSKEIIRNLTDCDDATGGHVQELQPREWARIWLNVLHDLRNGVKLKKLNEHERRRAPIEYELTPYEMLMDDIRSRRYTLNKVIVDGMLPPRVKREAHDIILDFIRSRPPLKPVPVDKPRESLRRESMYEKLMREIREKPSLKPAPARPLPETTSGKKRLGSYTSDPSESGGEEDIVYSDLDSPQLPRKVLKAEISLDWSEEESESEASRHHHKSDSHSRPTVINLVEEEDTEDENILEKAIQKIIDDHLEDRLTPQAEQASYEIVPSSPEKTLTISRSSISSFEEIKPDEIPPDSPRRHSVAMCQSYEMIEFPPMKPKLPSSTEECLSLTVEEVVHIRSVLVKAEIENLRVNPKLYKAVLQDKVCFSCKKKFTLFKKKYRCRLCKKLICTICCVKMYIPKEEFLHIPVESLSPKRSPSTPVKRSVSEPPTPSLRPKSQSLRRHLDVQRLRKQTPVENVCCECCTFLKTTRAGPSQADKTKRYSMPFSLSPAPIQKMNSTATLHW